MALLGVIVCNYTDVCEYTVACLIHLSVVCPTLLTWPGADVGERRGVYRWSWYLVRIVLIGMPTPLHMHVHSC